MDASKAQERLNLLLQHLWPFVEVQNWFGIDLSAEPQRLLAQYRIWAEQYRPKVEVLDIKGHRVNRNLFELFLQHRGLIPIRSAAVQWGMDQESFQKVLFEALKKDFISESEAKGDFPNVYRASLIGDFHKRFPKLERMTFVTYSGFVRLLHQEIEETLKVSIKPLICLTSQTIGEVPPEYAHDFDSITNRFAVKLFFHAWENIVVATM